MWHAASLWEAHAQFEFCQALESNLNSSANQWGILSSANPMYWKVMSWSFCIPFPLDLNRKPDTDKNSEKKYEYEPVLPGYTQKMGEIRQGHALFSRLRLPHLHLRSSPPTVLPSPWGAPLLCSCCHRSCAAPWFATFQFFGLLTCDVIQKKTPGWCTCGFSVHEVYNIIHLAVWPYPSYG